MNIIKAVVGVVAVAIILMLAGQARGQSKTDFTGVVNAVIAGAKNNALNSRLVKWDSVEAEMHQVAKNAKSMQDLRASFEMLLLSLKDDRGTIYDPSTNTHIAGVVNHKQPELPSEVKAATFHFEVLQNDVRYIRLIAAPIGSNVQEQAELIRLAVDSLSKQDAAHWIVDLRYTAGGEMNPLFAGIAPLLDEGLVATSINGKDQIKDMFTVHNGNFYVNQVPVAKFPTADKEMRNVKIAVLTSKYTSGAAEILALGFKGRKNTKLFGEATAGQMIGSTAIKISNNLMMTISETMYTDRKGTSYKDHVEPTVAIEFAPHTDVKHDKAIAEASLWLTANPMTDTSVKVTLN